MSKFKEIQRIESDVFEVIHFLHRIMKEGNLESYKKGLAALEALNDEYKELTGQYYIAQDRIVDYHSKQWEFSC